MHDGVRPWPVVGRDAELARAHEWLDDLGRGTGPGALVFHGSAGQGKSTLWQVVVDRAAQRGGLVLSARCSEAETTLGYAGLADLLVPVESLWRERLPEHLRSALAAAVMLMPRSSAETPLAVMRGAQLAFEAVCDGAAFLLLAVDDVQSLDQESARAVSYVLRRWTEGPLGLVTTWRAGAAEPIGMAALPGAVQVIEVGPLDDGLLAQLVRDRHHDALPASRLSQVVRDSGGNPFYALALADAPAGVEVPTTLGSAVEARLDSAGALAVPVIDLIAVRGPVPVATLLHDGLGSSLDAAVRRAVLTEVDGVVRFDHPLLARAAYLRLPPGRRVRLHQEAADAAASVEERALHLAQATTEPERSVATLLDDASGAAFARHADDAAGTLAQHAVRLTHPEEVRARARRLADMAWFWSSCRPEDARAAADEVLALGVRGTDRARALQVKNDTSLTWRESLHWLTEARAEPDIDPVLSVNLRAEHAWVSGCLKGSDLDAACDEARSAVEAAQGMPPRVRIGVTAVWCWLSSIRGDPETMARFQNCLMLDGPDVQPSNDFHVRLVYATHLAARGLWAEATAQLDIQEDAAARHGNDSILGLAQASRAWVELTRGDGAGLARLVARPRATTTMAAISRTELQVVAALVRARYGHPQARDLADDIPEISLEDLAFGPGWVTRTVDAVATVTEGRPELAADEFGSWLVLVAGGPVPRHELVTFFPEAVTALVAANRSREAAALLDTLNRHGQQGRQGRPDPLASVIESLGRGVIALAAGQVELARSHLTKAATGAEAIQARWLLAQATFSLGLTLHRAGRRTGAAEAFATAAAHFAAMAAEPWARRAEQHAHNAVPRPRRATLTDAESAVARAAAGGMSNAQIAAALFVTVPTVEAHLTRIYRKLGIRSRTALAHALRDHHD